MSSPFNNNQNQGPKMPKCDEFFAGIPFSSLTFYILLVCFWLIDLFTDIGANYMINDYQQTIQNFQLWRLFTSAFFQASLLMVCFIILNFQTFLPSLEIKKGSTFLIVDLISRNLKLQLAVLAISFVSSIFELKIFNFESGCIGLWFNYMTIFCWLNPKLMKLCCCNLKFNRKFYPFIFGLILSVLSWSLRADLIVGIILGLLQATVFKNFNDFFQMKHYEFLNNAFCKIGLSSFKNWIQLNPSRLTQKLCTLNVYSNLEFQQNQLLSSNDQIDNRSTKSTSNSQKNADHFSSLKGVRIGDY